MAQVAQIVGPIEIVSKAKTQFMTENSRRLLCFEQDQIDSSFLQDILYALVPKFATRWFVGHLVLEDEPPAAIRVLPAQTELAEFQSGYSGVLVHFIYLHLRG